MPHILRLMYLIWHLASRMPPGESAVRHVFAADRAASRDLPVEVVLAVAWVESRMDTTATSRVEGGRRAVGAWPSTRPAGSGPRFCGPMQTIAGADWSTCLAMRDPDVGYQKGADEIRTWLKIARAKLGIRGDLKSALRGHGCGVSGLTGSCMEYDLRVIEVAREYRWRP